MPSNQRIEDYALIGDCTSAALVAQWLDRLALLAALCFRRLLCGASRRARARRAACRKAADHAHPRCAARLAEAATNWNGIGRADH
jgi:hypothetical protein